METDKSRKQITTTDVEKKTYTAKRNGEFFYLQWLKCSCLTCYLLKIFENIKHHEVGL